LAAEGSTVKILAACAAVVLASAPGLAQSQHVETVVVIGTPIGSDGVSADKIAGDVETLSIPDLTANRPSDVLAGAVATQLSSVSLNDEQGSQFQPDFSYRGFAASPISGVAEGIAVYQDGVRLNESFGDNVNWDLIPQFAVDRFTIESSDPAFGLNALGGAVTLSMKNGLDFSGKDAQVSGGSFGNMTGFAEIGGRDGAFGFYLGVGAEYDDGFRYHSPANLRQAYGDVAYESGPWRMHLSASAAQNTIDAVGPTPIEMLAQDRRAVFTYPQSMRNAMALLQWRGEYRASDTLSFGFNTYYRHFGQRLIDGNTTDVDTCENDVSELCLEGGDDYPGDALYDASGNPVSASVLPAGATPGETDFTHTNSDTFGATVEMTSKDALFGHDNFFTAGASIDDGHTGYSAYGELGALLASLRVAGAGVIIDQSLSPTASPPIESPVDVSARNIYSGFYANDVFNITPTLTLNLSGRLNLAHIALDDRRGDSLDMSHSFSHFDPGAGLTYKFSDGLSAYAGYSQANRAPTAGELACADPTSPCLLDAFLVSDPPLKQVVSRDWEAGLRGHDAVFAGVIDWTVDAYRIDVSRDILLLATDVNGFGYFQNAGVTRHQGIDAHIGYRDEAWRVSLSYSWLDETFRDTEVLSSNSPAADGDGLIYVHPGDHVPMTPANRLVASADYIVTAPWSVGADLRWQSSAYYVGDASNEEPKLPGYATVNLRSSYRIGAFTIFGEIENLLNKRYATYATFTEFDGLPPSFYLGDPRTLSPAPGRLFFAGVRAEFN
jgi:iron complex outermembrane receptor protein